MCIDLGACRPRQSTGSAAPAAAAAAVAPAPAAGLLQDITMSVTIKAASTAGLKR
jgi:hypothetical protein